MIINLIDRVKLRFRKRDKELITALHDILGFVPHNIEIYRTALAHKSVSYRGRLGKPVNNERLEFLGDAILEAVVSDIVYHRYERKREGFLTSTRSKIVQRSSLNQLSAEIGLDSLINTNAHPTTHHNNIGGNAFEALVGAIYLDRGYAHCKWFIEKRIVGRLLDIDNVAQKEVNFKSKLLEWTQKNRIQAEYKLDKTEKDGTNSPIFHTSVVIEGLIAGEGTGFSKKESHQTAAREALMKLRREAKFVDDIFSAKEKRTAMEADAVCAVPKIDEIEEALAEEAHNKKQAGRHSAQRAPKKPAPVAGKQQAKPQQTKKPRPKPPVIDLPETEPGNDTESTDEQTAEEKRTKRRNTRKKGDVAERMSETEESTRPTAETETLTATENLEAATDNTADTKTEEQPSVHKPRNNSRRRRAQIARAAAIAEQEEAQGNRNSEETEGNDDTQHASAAADSPDDKTGNATAERKPRRRKPRAANDEKAESEKTQSNDTRISEAEREAIIQQAEEAAFNE